MPKPLIGLIGSRWSSSATQPNQRVHGQLVTYVDAVLAAGGLPVILPLGLPEADLHELYTRLDGLILPGGGDMDPQLYQAASHPATYGIDADRDRVELYLTRQAVDDRKPLFGICRGIQVLNVALGGSLYQDLPSEYPGGPAHYFHTPEFAVDHPAHGIQVAEESLLARCLGQPLVAVNSRHHQAARDVAPGLVVTARAPDGVIEALELPQHPFALAVQWHPENMQGRPEMKRLFEAFVGAAGGKSNW